MAVSTHTGFVDNWQGDKTVTACNLHMLTSQISCDVTFRVGEKEEIVKAHRYVLISRSCVFQAMLCGPLAESDAIKVPDVSKALFDEFLKFLYTDDCHVCPENVTGLLYLSKKYAAGHLEQKCRSYLESSLSADNACVILEQAHFFDDKSLFERALKEIHERGNYILKTPGFKDLCFECFRKIIKSEDLSTEPEQVFSASLMWAEVECRRKGLVVNPQNQRSVLQDTVFDIPFTGFNARHFVKTVLPSKILDEAESLKLLSYLSTCPESDVHPFKVFNRSQDSFQVALYRDTVQTGYDDVELFRTKKVCDVITFISSCDIYLCGLVLYSGGNATYLIRSVSQTGIDIGHETKAGDSLSLVEFAERKLVRQGTKCSLEVTHIGGHYPANIGKGLLNSIQCGKDTINVTREGENSWTRGMIAKLIVSHKPKT